MSSKWISKNLFENYVEEKQKEVSEKPNTMRRMDYVWPSPPMGTELKPKIYEGRFLPDQRGKFTKKYMYHMWKSGDKWIFYLCPKTHGMDKFCPICTVVNSLYTGTADDKKMAFKMKRKERHVGNFYVIDDPRDKEIDDDTKKSSGKVKLYEFPSKLESKLKNEILDKKEGLGFAIFDPGSEGHNIVIKIKATKQDAKGNTYPDYSDSIFSRKPSAIADSDAEIKKIMSSTYDIEEYIKSMEMSKENTLKTLKDEMLFDMVESEWHRAYGVEKASPKAKANVDDNDDVPDSVGEEKADDVDMSDEALLNELKNI
jgi:hypothetical protein